MAKCSRCKGYSSTKGFCDSCAWANMVEVRMKKREKYGIENESKTARQFFDDSIIKYKKTKYSRGL